MSGFSDRRPGVEIRHQPPPARGSRFPNASIILYVPHCPCEGNAGFHTQKASFAASLKKFQCPESARKDRWLPGDFTASGVTIVSFFTLDLGFRRGGAGGGLLGFLALGAALSVSQPLAFHTLSPGFHIASVIPARFRIAILNIPTKHRFYRLSRLELALD